MEPSGDAEEREAKEQLATVDGGRDERQVSTGNSWREMEREKDGETSKDVCPPPPPAR